MEKLNIAEICAMITVQIETLNPDIDRLRYWVDRLDEAQKEFKAYLDKHAEAQRNDTHDSSHPDFPRRYS